jgi:hypothetical protein
MVSLEFFIDINPSDRTMALGSTQLLTEMSTRSISWGQMRPVRKADLTTILCRCQKNLGTVTSWNPLGHSRPGTGLLYLFTYLLTSPLPNELNRLALPTHLSHISHSLQTYTCFISSWKYLLLTLCHYCPHAINTYTYK